MSERILAGQHFMNGDEAIAEGAIAAGCTVFAGYPITPQSEIAERVSYRLPQVGGVFIQMEDEISSMAAVLGAAWGGAKAMTATSGPGFSLMMENIGLGMMTETPCVVVDIQRGGPSTGLPTLVGQADMMQARWGSHGDYGVIALCPSSPQEAFELTIRAFNLSERFRLPVFVMADEVVGHMYERVVVDPDRIEIVERRAPNKPPGEFLLYAPGEDLVPQGMPAFGDGYRVHVTGLTHDERGYPVIDAATQRENVTRLSEKITRNAEEIVEIEATDLDGAEVVIVSYGISARTSLGALRAAQEKGLKAGMLRLVTVWPFPDRAVRDLLGHVAGFVVPEINLGQIVREVERVAGARAAVRSVPHAGGGIHDPQVIVAAMEEVLGRAA
ncbi:MAG: 2-oxoacid:acceptor oxidoreductase subunit alpha [Candidatus Bipolaricaulota bacterium]|nr:MAG: 2-oxoacid:acceptor oxidoreductase subunit alpha [Candidatus Bipolaricaulota bacterium]